MDSKEFVETYKSDSKYIKEKLDTQDETLHKVSELLECHATELKTLRESQDKLDKKLEAQDTDPATGEPVKGGEPNPPAGAPDEADTKDDKKLRKVEMPLDGDALDRVMAKVAEGEELSEEEKDVLAVAVDAAKGNSMSEDEDEDEERPPEEPERPKTEKAKTRAIAKYSRKKGSNARTLKEMSGRKLGKLLNEHFKKGE